MTNEERSNSPVKVTKTIAARDDEPPFTLSKEISDILDEMRAMNAMAEFDGPDNDDGYTTEGYNARSEKLKKIFAPVFNRFCQAGLITLAARITRDLNPKKIDSLQGKPKYAECSDDGLGIVLFLDENACADFRKYRRAKRRD